MMVKELQIDWAKQDSAAKYEEAFSNLGPTNLDQTSRMKLTDTNKQSKTRAM